MHSENTETVVLILIFAVWYFRVLLRRASLQEIDIYDFMMLSMVAIIPGLFALFPRFFLYISNSLGIAFPFVLLFGTLFAILFFFIHRLTTNLHILERNNRELLQQVSLLKHKLSENTSNKWNSNE